MLETVKAFKSLPIWSFTNVMPTVACLEGFEFPVVARVTGMCRRIIRHRVPNFRRDLLTEFSTLMQRVCPKQYTSNTKLNISSTILFLLSFLFLSSSHDVFTYFIVLTILKNLSSQLPLFWRKKFCVIGWFHMYVYFCLFCLSGDSYAFCIAPWDLFSSPATSAFFLQFLFVSILAAVYRFLLCIVFMSTRL